MDELVELVAEKAGISESQARIAVETVMGVLKEKLPEPLGSQIEGALEGDLPSGGIEGLAGGLGGLFKK